MQLLCGVSKQQIILCLFNLLLSHAYEQAQVHHLLTTGKVKLALSYFHIQIVKTFTHVV